MNRVGQPISIEYKMVHDFDEAVFRTFNLENVAILNLSSLGYILEEVEDVTLSEKNWMFSVTASQK